MPLEEGVLGLMAKVPFFPFLGLPLLPGDHWPLWPELVRFWAFLMQQDSALAAKGSGSAITSPAGVLLYFWSDFKGYFNMTSQADQLQRTNTYKEMNHRRTYLTKFANTASAAWQGVVGPERHLGQVGAGEGGGGHRGEGQEEKSKGTACRWHP